MDKNELVIACDMSVFTDAQREHHLTVVQQVFALVTEARELADGYAFRLPSDSALLFMLAEFMRDEHLCCPFWTFKLEVEPPGGAIWLHLTGPEGVKQLVAADLAGVLDSEVAAAVGITR
jgi:hypothetical protein